MRHSAPPRSVLLLRSLAEADPRSRAIPAAPGTFLLSSTIGPIRDARQSTPPQVGPGRRLFVPPTAHYNRSQLGRAANQTP